MKPSEALTAIQMLGALVKDLEARTEGARALDMSIRSDMDARTIDLETAGERAAALVTEEYGGPEELAPFAGLIKEARLFPGDRALNAEDVEVKGGVVYAKDDAPYGRRADGTPKVKPGKKTKTPEGPPLVAVLDQKPHVAPLTSPLTDDLRATLEHALGTSPTTAYALSKLSALHGFDVDGLLCEAPDTFINWTDPGPQKYSLWGLPHQFDGAVKMLTVPSQEPARSARTSEALGCSVSAALAAWKRLDPEAT